MKTVTVQPPSFPEATPHQSLTPVPGKVWQVICGDKGHWRLGYYSPSFTRQQDCTELESHSCPEVFVLLSGRLILVLADHAQERLVELEVGRPMLVTAPHSGFCPDGPHTGVALVVERDAFCTNYQKVEDWLNSQSHHK